MFTRLRSWCRNLLSRRQVEAALDEEVRACVEILTAEKIHAGLAPAEARRRALLETGGTESVKTRVREGRTAARTDRFLWDCRHAVRMLRRHPLMTTVSVLLLAVSVCLACSSFALLDAIVLRTLPIPRPDRVVSIIEIKPNQVGGRGALTAGLIEELRSRASQDVLQVMGFKGYLLSIDAGTGARGGTVVGVVGDYFALLNGHPAHGRIFGPDESDEVAVVSDAFWRAALNADPQVLGRTIRLGVVQVPIVGIMPPSFVGAQPESPGDIIVPWTTMQRGRGLTGGQMFTGPTEGVARLRDGVSVSQFDDHLNAMWPAMVDAANPAGTTVEKWRDAHMGRVAVLPFSTGLSYLKIGQPDMPRAIGMTFCLALLVCLATCLTIALLAVARGVRQRREMAIMLAVGGNRRRVIRPYLLESAFLAVGGCIAGLTCAAWGIKLAARLSPAAWGVALDGRTIAIALGVSLIAAAVGGLFGAFLVTRTSVLTALREQMADGHGHLRLRVGLLSPQFAVAVVLVQYALLYVVNLSGLLTVPLGFNPNDLQFHTLSGLLPARTLDRKYFQQLRDELGQIPGVDNVALSLASIPLQSALDSARPLTSDEGREVRAITATAFPGFLNGIGLPLQAGRDLAWDDGPVAVVTATLAGRLFPDGRVLGRTVRATTGSGSTAAIRTFQIVGVTADITYNGPRLGPSPMLFVPVFEAYTPVSSNYAICVGLRTSRDLDSVTADLRGVVDRFGAQYVVSSRLDVDYLAATLKQDRMLATVSGAAGGMIMLLTSIGLYAFCTYVFVLRTREFAIRAALGAAPRRIGAAALSETWRVLVFGSLMGIACSVAIRAVLSTFVAGLAVPTTAALVGALAIVAVIALGATGIPTVRAMRLDIAKALRVG